MSKVAATYWDNTISLPRTRISQTNSRTRMKSKRAVATPRWFVFTIIVSMTFMLCLTINFRAFSELGGETEQYQKLTVEVDRLTNENLALQEEIHTLKTDSAAIEREARKLGMSRPGEKILVPAN